MINHFLFFLVFSSLSFSDSTESGALHEFHVSKVQVDYNLDDQAVQISMHIFIDDLEEALREQGVEGLFLCTEKESEDADKHLEDYLNQVFQIKIDEKTAPYEFLGKEPSEDLLAVWCYLEIPNIEQLEQLSISNSVLMEIFDDQKNIIQVTKSGKNQGYLLFSKGSSSDVVRF